MRSLIDGVKHILGVVNTMACIPPQSEIEAAYEAQLREAFAGRKDIDALVASGMKQFKVIQRRQMVEAFGEDVNVTVLLDEATDLNSITRGIAADIMRAKGVKYDPHRGWEDQFMELMQAKPDLLSVEVAERLASLNVDAVTFARGFKAITSESGAILQKAAAPAQHIKSAMMVASTPEEFTVINTLLGLGGRLSPTSRFGSFWDGTTTLIRASLTAPLSTAMRNILSVETIRLPADAMVQVFNNYLRRAFEAAAPKTRVTFLGKERSFFTEEVLTPGFAKANEIQALGIYTKLLTSSFKFKGKGKSNFKFVQEVLLKGGFTHERNELFMQFASDITLRKGGKVITKINQYASIINIQNRAQEILVRTAIMSSRIDDKLRQAGLTRAALEDPSIYSTVFTKEVIRKLVNETLDLTFAKQDFGAFGKAFINAVNKLGPIGAAELPFPRFLINAIEFGFDHSPLVISRFASKAERAAFRAGDPTRISQFAVGTGLWWATGKLYDACNKGNKWYELECGDEGDIFDIRPFVVGLGAMFFIHDVLRRREDGTLQEMNMEEVIEGIASTRTGDIKLFDAFNAASKEIAGIKENDPELQTRAWQEFVGGLIQGLGRPLKTLNDLLALAGQEELINVKSTANDPMIGPFIKEIPPGTPIFEQLGLTKGELPDAPSATRSGPIKTATSPLFALLGIPIRDPKNLIEKEIDRLDIPNRNVRFSSVDPILDEALNNELGPAMEEVVLPLLERGGLNGMTTPEQSKALKGFMRMAKGIAEVTVMGRKDEMTERLFRERLRRMSLDDRRILQDVAPEVSKSILELMIMHNADSFDSPEFSDATRRSIFIQLGVDDR